jgi:hypothetical protein
VSLTLTVERRDEEPPATVAEDVIGPELPSSKSVTVKTTFVDVSSLKLNVDGSPWTSGGSTTAFTVTLTVLVSLLIPSLTTTLTLALPFLLFLGVSTRVRVRPLPVIVAVCNTPPPVTIVACQVATLAALPQ